VDLFLGHQSTVGVKLNLLALRGSHLPIRTNVCPLTASEKIVITKGSFHGPIGLVHVEIVLNKEGKS